MDNTNIQNGERVNDETNVPSCFPGYRHLGALGFSHVGFGGSSVRWLSVI